MVNKPKEVVGNGDKPKFVDCKREEKQGAAKDVTLIILTSTRALIEDVPFRDNTATNSYSLGKKSSHFGKKDMFIHNPGGLVQK